jgi:ribosomal protein L23
MARKSTGSKLDVLSAEDRESLLELADGSEGVMPVSLEELVERILTKWDIKLGKSALGEWLAKQRDAKEFDAWLDKVGNASGQADAIVEAAGKSGQLTEAAITGLGTALNLALVSGNPLITESAAKSFSALLTAHASNKKADAAIDMAQTAREKFQFDAAKAALAHAEELQEINRDETDDKTKVARAIKRLFGEKPKNVRTAAEVLAEEEEAV